MSLLFIRLIGSIIKWSFWGNCMCLYVCQSRISRLPRSFSLPHEIKMLSLTTGLFFCCLFVAFLSMCWFVSVRRCKQPVCLYSLSLITVHLSLSLSLSVSILFCPWLSVSPRLSLSVSTLYPWLSVCLSLCLCARPLLREVLGPRLFVQIATTTFISVTETVVFVVS